MFSSRGGRAGRRLPGSPPAAGEQANEQENKMKPFEALWRSRKFWLAVVAVLQTVVFTLLPGFPDEVWQAINVILLWLIGTIAVEDAAQKIRN